MDPVPPHFAPSATLPVLRARARLLARVRSFFAERDVLEVETPLLCSAGAVDEHLEPIPVAVPGVGERYLVTSPELSMKRMLAAGVGAIYQITRAFRLGERGRLHNPEFTLVEWYRPDRDDRALMDEVEALCRVLFADVRDGPAAAAVVTPGPYERITYQQAFERALALDPLEASGDQLSAAARAAGVLPEGDPPVDSQELLDLLLSTCVQATLGRERPTFVTDYPAAQAALARLRPDDPRTAARFELFVAGIELANGYHELTDPVEQAARFRAAGEARRRRGRRELPLDARFLAALEAGLPDCAGVALGFDRVVMLAVGADSLDEVLAFPFDRA